LMKHLRAARILRRLTQKDLADRCGLRQSVISRIEGGFREPALEEVVRLAGALDLPVEWFLTGQERSGKSLVDISQELRHLGLVDLRVPGERVPGAHRNPEEVAALAVGTEVPDPRVLEGMPAILAWNRWRPALLVAFAQVTHPKAPTRLAWLAEITLLLDRTGGFPGGIPGADDLVSFLQRVERPDASDHMGVTGARSPEHRAWTYWRIQYPMDLQGFRDRALTLWTLRQGQTDA